MNMDYFNAEKVRDELVNWIRIWFGKNGPTSNAIIGISGGKDSTIVAGLCVRALGKDRVIGVLMPNGTQKDIADSHRVCEALGIKNITVDIQDGYYGIAEEVEDKVVNDLGLGIKGLSEQSKINLAPRLRMATLYAVAQTVGGRVIKTSNESEYTTGYFTRWGDECGDVKPLINLTKSEVVEIGKTMPEIPIDLIVKEPSDGLTGKTDEDKIGFTYDNLDKYIRGYSLDIQKDVIEKIEKRLNSVKFKRHSPDEFIHYDEDLPF